MTVNDKNNFPIVTPTLWQSVILRNVGLVKDEIIAKTLNCSLAVLKAEKKRLGLDKIKYNSQYREKSYISIIRNNWQIIPNDQIMSLLEMSEKDFEFELKETDFLSVKLGEKPYCENAYYVPLTEEQNKKTKEIRKIVNKYFIKNYVSPFGFKYNNYNAKDNGKLTIVYPYSAPYGDILLTSHNLVDDNELLAMKNAGVTGIWFQGLLSKLAEYPFSKEQSQQYLIRLANLNLFVEKAKKYGIGVYLYLNEPRSIKIPELKDEYKYLAGRVEGDEVALCISQEEVKDYLYHATQTLVSMVPDLAGIITITSSENLTHCKHKIGSDCQKCKDLRPYQLATLVNNIMQSAIDNCKSRCKLIANLWGWAPYCDFTNEEVKKGIQELNEKITILCVSEFGTHIDNGKEYQIGEYSISHGEPCLETIENLTYAKSLERNIMAKIQANNSWEMSTIPFIPAYECVIDHIKKLNDLGVKDLMASWTLGGYPSPTLSLLNSYNKDFSYDEWLKIMFKSDAKNVKKAVHYFSNGFKHFPFDADTLYFSSLHMGPLNPYFAKKSNMKASMVTFPYDDIDSWIKVDNEKEIISEFQTLLSIWKKGLPIIDKVRNKEIKDTSHVFYINISSFVNQYLFYSHKMDKETFFRKELHNVKELYKIASKNSTIGFEASNHYLYQQNLFLEKIISLKLK